MLKNYEITIWQLSLFSYYEGDSILAILKSNIGAPVPVDIKANCTTYEYVLFNKNVSRIYLQYYNIDSCQIYYQTNICT